jgi:hypothetical protein
MVKINELLKKIITPAFDPIHGMKFIVEQSQFLPKDKEPKRFSLVGELTIPQREELERRLGSGFNIEFRENHIDVYRI